MDQKIQAQFNHLWTTQNLCRLFGCTPMTITNWRRNKDLPTIIIPGGLKPTVRFVPQDILRWARRNKIGVNRFDDSEIAPS
jgi:hypothetical protein